jgi:hypothetical protein
VGDGMTGDHMILRGGGVTSHAILMKQCLDIASRSRFAHGDLRWKLFDYFGI